MFNGKHLQISILLQSPQKIPTYLKMSISRGEKDRLITHYYLNYWLTYWLIWKTKKSLTRCIQLVKPYSLRRERDSNPRCLAAQRFSRPPQSTTLPSLRVQKYDTFFYLPNIFAIFLIKFFEFFSSKYLHGSKKRITFALGNQIDDHWRDGRVVDCGGLENR